MKIKVKNNVKLPNEKEIKKTFGLKQEEIHLLKFMLTLVKNGKIKKQRYSFNISDFCELDENNPNDMKSFLDMLLNLSQPIGIPTTNNGRITVVTLDSFISNPLVATGEGWVSYILNPFPIERYELLQKETTER